MTKADLAALAALATLPTDSDEFDAALERARAAYQASLEAMRANRTHASERALVDATRTLNTLELLSL